MTSKRGVHIKYRPYAFTEQGVAMLSSVLKSHRAIEVNVQIIRTFTKLRELLLTHKELREKIESLERHYAKHDKQFKIVFDLIKRLLDERSEPPKSIGFRPRS